MRDKAFVLSQIVGVALIVAACTVAFEWIGFLLSAGVATLLGGTVGEFLTIEDVPDESADAEAAS